MAVSVTAPIILAGLLAVGGEPAKPPVFGFGEPVKPDVGFLDIFPGPRTIGPVDPAWPLVVVADYSRDLASAGFGAPPRLDPPNGRRKWWDRQQGLFLAGPPGPAADRFELAEVVRDGRKLTAVVEGWRTAGADKPDETRRPTQVASILPLLDPGEYDLTGVWREFRPIAGTPFWRLAAVRRATARLPVCAGEPPARSVAPGLAASDFREVPVEPAEAARRWVPVPAVERVSTVRGYEGLTDPVAVGVAAGTFDPADWKDHRFDHLPAEEGRKWIRNGPAKPAPVRPAAPTDPIYAVVYGPLEVNTDHCRVRAIEWAGGGYVLHLQFFNTGMVNGSNVTTRSAYVLRLPAPTVDGPGGPKAISGRVPVTVRWAVLHGRHSHVTDAAAFRPLGPDETVAAQHGWFQGRASAEYPRPAWMDHGSRGELTILP